MLKTRLWTGLFLGSSLIASVFLLGTAGLAGVLGAFMLVAAFEWSRLAGLTQRRALGAVILLACLAGISLSVPLTAILGAALAWWLWAMIEVFIFPDRRGLVWRHAWAQMVGGALVLVPAWRGLVALKAETPGDPWLLVGVFVMVWSADTVAYFVGRGFGRHKLAPLVSPGKSVEGALGGLAAAGAVGALGALGLGVWAPVGLAFGVVTAAFSVVGDLLESKAKRLAGVKDSGWVFPGHGGVLDRIDALTAAVPVFVLGVRWMGVG